MSQEPLSLDPALQLLGETIRMYRKQRGLNQKELAALAGLDSAYISEIETGKRNIMILSLLRLAAALKVPIAHLLQPLENHSGLYKPPLE